MGRNKATVKKKGNTTSTQMARALDFHFKFKHSIREAAKLCGIPYQTLQKYVSKSRKGELSTLEPNYSVNKVFTEEQETSLHDYIIDCADKFYGLTSKDCRINAFQMAKKNQINMPKSWEENGIAGRDWLRGFKKRFPDLSVKKPEACSLARSTAFNRTNVQSFYNNL